MASVRAVLVAMVALGLAAAATAGDVSGTWTAEFDTQVGVQKYVFEFQVDGEKLTGSATAERMGQTDDVELEEGKLKGDEISFSETFEFQGQKIVISYEGTVKGDEIELTRNVGEFATEKLVAKRKKQE